VTFVKKKMQTNERKQKNMKKFTDKKKEMPFTF
jgi:hypothetical protein